MTSIFNLTLYLSSFQLGFLFLGFVLLTITKNHSDSLSTFLSSILWFLGLLNVSFHLLGSLAVLATLCLFLVAVILSFMWRNKTQIHHAKEEPILAAVSELHSEGEASSERVTRDEHHIAPAPSGMECCKTLAAISSTDVKESLVRKRKLNKGASKSLKFTDIKPATREDSCSSIGGSISSINMETLSDIESSVEGEAKGVTCMMLATTSSEEVDGSPVRTTSRFRLQHTTVSAESALRARKSNNYVFVVLIVACLMVCFWKYPLLFVLLVPLLLWVVLGKVLYPYIRPHVQLRLRMRAIILTIASLFSSKTWLFFPPPITTLGRMFLLVDHMILKLAIQSVGGIVSLCIIVGLLVSVTAAFVLLMFQIQVELSHYVTVGTVVWNKTLEANPQLVQ